MKIPDNVTIYATPPSPVVLASTIDKKGNKNLAAFGFFGLCSHIPGMVTIGVRKTIQTYKNMKATGQFVIGIPTPKIAKNVYATADKLRKEDAFKECGLTPIKSAKVKPFRIKECQVNFECKVVKIIETGDHILVIAEIIESDCDPKIYANNKRDFRLNIDALYHATGSVFKTGKGKVIEVGGNK